MRDRLSAFTRTLVSARKTMSVSATRFSSNCHVWNGNNHNQQPQRVLGIIPDGGDRGIRTPDLCDANAALSQLSYIPSQRL